MLKLCQLFWNALDILSMLTFRNARRTDYPSPSPEKMPFQEVFGFATQPQRKPSNQSFPFARTKVQVVWRMNDGIATWPMQAWASNVNKSSSNQKYTIQINSIINDRSE